MLIVSGFDGTSSAGIILDAFVAKVFEVNHYCVVSALNMQNHSNYYGTELLSIEKQLQGVDFEPEFVKIGLLHNAKNVEIIAGFLKKFPNAKIICDTPIVSSSGKNLVENVHEYLKVFQEKLLPMVFLLTPNLDELNYFGSIETILKSGCQNVLVKGGHANGEFAEDVLYCINKIQEFSLPRIYLQGKNVRGTGCALATAIACFLQTGLKLEDAISNAKQFIHYGISNSANANTHTKTLNFNGFTS
jgi:hydroxymethylpyrimidine kinase/phosphomethylpyrimidine kinase